MNNDVRRFTPFQIAYHWAQALPYLVLLATGGILLVERGAAIEFIPIKTLSQIHKICGFVMIATIGQTILVALIARRFSELGLTFTEALLWHPRDLRWLLKIPLNTLLGRISVPSSGYLNAGQKIHVLLQAVAVPVFIVTGLAMIFVPGALAPWIVHAVLFVPTLSFVLLHIFLSLINPETRKSLRTAFTGFVSTTYAIKHHAVWMGAGEREESGSFVSLPILVATLAVACALIAAGIWAYGPEAAVARGKELWQQQGADLILPGHVCASHTVDPGQYDCLSCHTYFDTNPSSSCLACHTKIGNVLAKRIGYHGRLEGECVSCHPDHGGLNFDIRQFDGATFNHNQARYSLQGKHQTTACKGCHLRDRPGNEYQRTQYIDLRFKMCLDCHDDPHESPEFEDCKRCHTLDGWNAPHLLFDHNRDTRFLLNGQHIVTPCAGCHKDEDGNLLLRFHEVGNHCIDCHDDPHRGSLGMDCKQCHSEDSWTGRQVHFDHNRDSDFHLLGKHTETKCEACHVPEDGKPLGAAKFKELGTRCADCHEDPHRGQFKQSCEECHSEQGWTGRWVRDAHGAGAEFPLLGKHANVQCVECHSVPDGNAPLAAARFAGVSRTCVGCHPDPHEGQMRHECKTCHSEKGWKGSHLLFSHDEHSTFRIDALHSGVACAACHPGTDKPLYRPLPNTCETCHDDIEKGMQGIVSWASGAPDPHYGRVGCLECHPQDVPPQSAADYGRLCAHCHTQHYEGLYHDWNKSLNERITQIQYSLLGDTPTDDIKDAGPTDRLKVIQKLGSHNVQFSRSLLDGLVRK